ncbi:Sigma2 domain of RNA polymerase sigma factor, partial [Fragilariopsis cylindrus CCMP1102]
LLTHDEEREITYSIRDLHKAVKIRDELEDDEFPTEEDWAKACGLEVMVLRRIMSKGQEARTVLVSANAGLVTSIAKRHYHALKQATDAMGGVGTILTLQDMIQEGNFGLMKAAERFEPERGWRFSTYATYWIRQRILRSISDSSRVIRLPAHVTATLQKLNRARKEMAAEIGRVPSDPELAHYMKISVDKLRKINDKARSVVSLESPLRQGTNHKAEMDQRTIGDFIASDAPTPEDDFQHRSLQRDIRAVINELAEREREVLILRFGLDNGESMSTSQTAMRLGITIDRVRYVEARALNKLRSPQRNYRLKDYL